MEMQVNSEMLKQERIKRAWSQEHLAQVTGLGLRTIQRIETSGMASNESISAIATAFDTTVAEFVADRPSLPAGKIIPMFQKYRLWAALAVALFAQLGSPPQLTVALACAWMWVAFEIFMVFVARRTHLKKYS